MSQFSILRKSKVKYRYIIWRSILKVILSTRHLIIESFSFKKSEDSFLVRKSKN